MQAEYRPALDTVGWAWAGGGDLPLRHAGRRRRLHAAVSELGREIFEQALDRLENCPADCEESCYRCLRSFRNRFEHTLLDRHVGASLLRYLLYGTLPTLAPERLERSAEKLYEDLERSGVEGVHFERNVTVDVAGVGPVLVPILATKDSGARALIGVHGPLTPDVAPTPQLHRVAQETFERVKLVDDLIIARSLPNASREVLEFIR